MTEVTKRVETEVDLKKAHSGSYYTIIGAGGDLQEWVDGYEKILAEKEIGKPSKWFQTTGGAINLFATEKRGGELAKGDKFKNDLVCLMFPLDGLNSGKLAMLKLQMQDRWFDDIIDNMVSR